jgi:uncharacterized protein
LRGFAILGVLISNLPMIAAPPFGLYSDYTELSYVCMALVYFFISGKFFVIFSFVFGYGFTILLKSSLTKGLNPKGIFFRRILGLFLFGILHAVFFFNGDILVSYAIMGCFLFLLKDSDDQKILKLSLIFWILSALFYGIIGLMLVFGSSEGNATMAELTRKSISGYSGNFFEASKQRIYELQFSYPFIILFNWPTAFCMFLVGLWMGKKNTLENPNSFFSKFKGRWIWIFLLGCLGNAFYVWGNFNSTNFFQSFLLNASLAIGGLSFALIYCYLLYKISLLDFYFIKLIRESIAKAGTMSLTNYLIQSMIMAWFFNGWGLGYYGKLSPEKFLLLVIPIYIFNLIFSMIWLKFFNLGPFEIFLRKLTYYNPAKNS